MRAAWHFYSLIVMQGLLIKVWKTMFSDTTNNFAWFVSYYMYCTARDRWGTRAQENILLFMVLWVRKVQEFLLCDLLKQFTYLCFLWFCFCCLKKCVMGQQGSYKKDIFKVTCSCKKSHFLINSPFIMT